MALTGKRLRFVTEYVKDQNATQAAKRAGFAEKTAYSQGQRLLKNVEIHGLIQEALAKVREQAIVDATYVLTRLKTVVERSLEAEPVMEFDPDEKEMVQKKVMSAETGKMVGLYEFDSAGANGALRMLGQHLKLFTEKLEVDVTENLADLMKAARERVNRAR